MRIAFASIVAVALAASFAAEAARADHRPAVVVPGKPGVPVVIRGIDATGAAVWGDWGLARPGAPVMIEGPVSYVAPWWTGGYHPATGRPPRYGRLEVEPPPNRVLPAPAADFRRTWTSEPDPRVPVTEYPPFDPPPVILAPRNHRR